MGPRRNNSNRAPISVGQRAERGTSLETSQNFHGSARYTRAGKRTAIGDMESEMSKMHYVGNAQWSGDEVAADALKKRVVKKSIYMPEEQRPPVDSINPERFGTTSCMLEKQSMQVERVRALDGAPGCQGGVALKECIPNSGKWQESSYFRIMSV
ncbi:hypothetical protein BS47DRAFT_1368310 [Hydnum rufescens UP504]|uniref:Uncharacterized protein n=1 Tax=Hydnum rufescens UP504 TaxID=1448309 RepID=A0A9P6AGY0_9AGAM|nr:hypothetical protein BS47DRAFT_1368310 [Hydnum rufescens UP504]